MVVDHRLTANPDFGLALSPDLPAETVGVHERMDQRRSTVIEQHRRLAAV